jgi:uncharacterized membrane protein YdbT with pleckstrin-like domain/DNA-directed RNA polymerase subunit RPC12/RpoP
MQAQTLTYVCPHCGKPTEVEPTSGEQLLTCPNAECRKPFQVELPQAKPAPALIAPQELREQINGEGPPPALAQPAPPAESELVTVRPQMFRRHPLQYTMLVGLALLGLAGLIFALFNGWAWLALVGLAVGLYASVRFALWWQRSRTTTMTVTTRRTILRSGVLTNYTLEIPHEEVQDVQVQKSLCDRIFKVGDLIITGPEDKGKIIHLLGVPGAEDIASQIQARRQL